ncbi:ring-1,2-phenylacetyl-CoA epoxidase subunit PaaE [Tenacibaculum adriaticum]|uniref:Ring-1,2-phenylacetyl-CoA epoxidase subunit PaaE n=1 Tax=Tenacibaculum adriaticum TaxID=413713 RepID=A0A5S5DUY9_9FLAO|nr:2Fe-2S iron-sulfur cluster-binding protein [Tenacibaculum adriaticum]TYP99753.1 ring-1,2-phenylacetyl-CoA epoxidase subunit PaaE [Tenacibaculum adriaticum]
MNTFHPLKIKNIIKETSDAVSIIFDIPTHLQNDFTFIAGQYITIKATIKGEEVRRAYSLCSSPKSGEIKVAVKAVENGMFSVYATTELKIGDTLEVSKPEGKFILQPQADKNYIGFAAGSGITPILSMIKSVLESEPSSTFTLIYGNKSVTDTIFFNDLNILEQNYPQQFKLHYVFSREQQENALFGRIEKGQVNYFVKNLYKDISFSNAFLCGPEEMIETISETLQDNGFTSENISYELFSASIDEEAAAQVKEGESEITVVLDDEETTFTMKQTDNILSASLRHKLDAPYSCQGGVCSSCIAKVTEGKAVMVKNQILTDDELEDGFILTCQAHPTTPKIVVDFDDV